MTESTRVQPRIEEVKGLTVVTFGIEGNSFQDAVDIGNTANALRGLPPSYRMSAVKAVLKYGIHNHNTNDDDIGDFYKNIRGTFIHGTDGENVEIADYEALRVFGAFTTDKVNHVVGLFEVAPLTATEEDGPLSKFLISDLGVQFPDEAMLEIENTNSGLLQVPFVGSISRYPNIPREIMAICFNPNSAILVHAGIEAEETMLSDPDYTANVLHTIGRTAIQ